jgi:hypothetical protein
MDNQENLQDGQGSMQKQTQGSQRFDGQQEEHAANGDKFGVVPAPQAQGSDADKDRGGEPSIDNNDDDFDSKDNDDEEIIPGLRARNNPWNSITFDADDFFGGLVPA